MAKQVLSKKSLSALIGAQKDAKTTVQISPIHKLTVEGSPKSVTNRALLALIRKKNGATLTERVETKSGKVVYITVELTVQQAEAFLDRK